MYGTADSLMLTQYVVQQTHYMWYSREFNADKICWVQKTF